MVNISLPFKKFTNFTGQTTRDFLGLRTRHFQGISFISRQTYSEIFKSALVYLYKFVFIISQNIDKHISFYGGSFLKAVILASYIRKGN